MKHLTPLILAIGWLMCGSSLRAEHTTQLKGIVDLPGLRMALVEVKHTLNSVANATPKIIIKTHLIKLGASLTDQTIKGAHVQFEILEIDSRNETVRLREDGSDILCRFEGDGKAATNTRSNNFGCHLQDVRFEDALNLYSDFKDRVVLIHPKIVWSPVSLSSEAQTKADIAGGLEEVFLKQGIKTIADGKKFVWLIPASYEKELRPHSEQLDANSPPYGSIFMDSPLKTLIEQYGQILERKRISNDWTPDARVYLRTKMLTRAEALYAFDTMLAWNRLKIVPVADSEYKIEALP